MHALVTPNSSNALIIAKTTKTPPIQEEAAPTKTHTAYQIAARPMRFPLPGLVRQHLEPASYTDCRNAGNMIVGIDLNRPMTAIFAAADAAPANGFKTQSVRSVTGVTSRTSCSISEERMTAARDKLARRFFCTNDH